MKICVSRDPASFLFLAAKEKLFFENQNLKVEILEKDAETSFVFLKNQRVDCAILPFSTFLEEYSKSLSFDILPGFHVCSSPLHIFHLNKENLINLHSENSYIAIPSENSLEELYARSILELLFSKNEEFPAIRVAQFEPEEELQQKGCIGYALNPIQHPISGKWKILEQEISGQISKKMPALSKFYPLYCTAFSANFLSQNAEELNPFISALKDCLKFLSSLEEGAIFSFIQSLKQKDHFAHFNFRELKHWFSDKNKVFKNLLNFQADRSHYKNLTQLQTSKNNLSSHKKNIEKLYVIFNGNYREPNLIKKQLVSSGNRNKLSNKKNLPEKHEYIHALLDLIEEKPIESSKVNADFKQLLKELSLDKKNQIQKAEKLSAKLTELKNKLFERDKKRVKKNTAFLTLLSLSSEPLLLIDVEYDKFIIYNYNSKFAEAIGYSETELLGKPFLYILRKPLRLKELKDSILDRAGLFLEEVSLKHRSFPSIEVDLSHRLVSFEGKDFLLA
ncbi:MAG: hypothetical protein KDK45_15875, partial [Leptospiraceae bacterium]|nr:hypothetical protein [Leptospiraceae bacterium]